MKIAPLADVKARLSAYITQAAEDGPIVITRNGKAVAVLIAPENEEDLEMLILARSSRLRAIFDQADQGISTGKGLPHGEDLAAREPLEGELGTVTEQINKALAIQDSTLDPFFVELQRRSLPKDEW